MEHDSMDVMIVGGGMAGGMLAAALADTGLRVRVLDAAPEPAMPEGPARPHLRSRADGV